jgi:hypothetical protein
VLALVVHPVGLLVCLVGDGASARFLGPIAFGAAISQLV